MAPRGDRSSSCSTKSEQSASDTEVTSQNKNYKKICNKIANVRGTINEKQKVLKSHEEEAKHSSELSSENDARAHDFVRSLKKDGNGRAERKQERRKVAAESLHRPSDETTASTVREPTTVRKTKREISNYNEGLLKLITELVKKHPQIKETVLELSHQIPSLRSRHILPPEVEEPTCSRYVKNTTNDQIRNTLPSSSREANSSFETKEHKKLKSAEDELEKHINTLLREHVDDGTELAQSLIFNKSNDLEEYANRLVQNGLGRIVEDVIRINRKNNTNAYIQLSSERNSGIRDAMILLPVARKYAFDGDIVRAFVFNPECTTNIEVAGGVENEESNEIDTLNDSSVQHCPKGFVIAIVEKINQRQFIGAACFRNHVTIDGVKYYKLRPNDLRVPMVFLPHSTYRYYARESEKREMDTLFLAKVVETNINGHCIGEIIQEIGKAGEIEAETTAILMSNGLHEIKPYEERFNVMFENTPLEIVAEDLVHREDLRKLCIFTIDPLTARDLDDAVSIEVIGDDEYEIGVHISDVSHYLLEGTELDDIVKNRATSIYLVNDVIHMLPQSLCFKCSLLPGEDKFAFSVFWRLNGNGEVLAPPRFTRSVLNSCTQFAYEHAQRIIDNPKENFTIDDLPTILNGFTISDIVSKILLLHSIAVKLREKRYENGALSLNNMKMRFRLDPLTGEPLNYEIEERLEANFLIEEFMLLANQTVAKFIYENYPDISILRYHEPPLTNGMKKVYDKLLAFGITLKYESSKMLQESMKEICKNAIYPDAMEVYLNNLLTKPMARAKYYCSSSVAKPSDMQHYALSIPIYTHFTSPIRRYPDIMVHRLLAAALNYIERPKRDVDELKDLAKICNDQKFNAKTAGDESTVVYLKRLIKISDSIIFRCIISEIFKNKMTVLSIETGVAINVQYHNQPAVIDNTNTPSFIVIVDRPSNEPERKLSVLSVILVKLISCYDKLQGMLVLSAKDRGVVKRVKHPNRRRKALHQQSRANNQERRNVNKNTGKEIDLKIQDLKIKD